MTTAVCLPPPAHTGLITAKTRQAVAQHSAISDYRLNVTENNLSQAVNLHLAVVQHCTSLIVICRALCCSQSSQHLRCRRGYARPRPVDCPNACSAQRCVVCLRHYSAHNNVNVRQAVPAKLFHELWDQRSVAGCL